MDSKTGMPTARAAGLPLTWSIRAKLLVGFAVVLAVLFGRPLWTLICYAWQSDLYSYILLVPFISGYLLWSKRRSLMTDSKPSWVLASVVGVFALGMLVGYRVLVRLGWKPSTEAYLAIMALSLLAILASVAFLCLGRLALSRVVFPCALLFFMVPVPDALLQPVVTFLQFRSADVAAVLFSFFGTPYLRQDTYFQLPGMHLEVAPECSGIHSTLVLFITSLVAGYLFLRSPWRRAVLTFSVIPLALLRNGFRVFVIGQLCVHIGPDMINSPIHRRGGPLFFVLSLIPFFLLLLALWKTEWKMTSPISSSPLASDSSATFSKPAC